MPIYEYRTVNPKTACTYCGNGFEIIQSIDEKPLLSCPRCGKKIKKMISSCHSAVIERAPDQIQVENRIREYEKSGMWSHAAELADSHSEKTKDKNLKSRALENYKKAGYDAGSLDKHMESNND